MIFIYISLFIYFLAFRFGGIYIIDYVLIFYVICNFVLFNHSINKITLLKYTFIFLTALFYYFNLFSGFTPTSIGLTLFFKILLLIYVYKFTNIKIVKLGFVQLRNLIYTLFIINFSICFYTITSFISSFERTSFPLSSPPESHLFGSYLVFTYIFFSIIYKKFKINFVFYSLYTVVLLISILTTGSRVSIVILTLYIILLMLRKITLKKITLAALVIIILYSFTNYHLGLDVHNRMFTFSLDNASEMKRLDRLEFVTDIDNYGNYFGHWFLSSSFLYFDGIISFIIYNTGFFGLFIFSLFTLSLFYLYFKNGNYSTLFLLLVIISQISSESFLVSRWFFPIIIFYIIIKRVFNKNYILTA